MRQATQPTQPEPKRISQIQGLSNQEVVERRARGEVSRIRFQSTYSLGQIWRENVFTFFILDLLGLTVVLWLLGNTMGAFWNFVLFVIVVLLNLVQDIGSKLWRDRIAKRARSKATVIREGRLEELAPASVIFEAAYSPSNYTYPSHVSFFLGDSYRAHNYHFGAGRDYERYQEEYPLAERLAELGYHPVLFTENSWILAADKGFAEVRFWPMMESYPDNFKRECEFGGFRPIRKYPSPFIGRMIADAAS